MASEAQKRAVRKYDAANVVQIKIKLNRKTDADIIEHLSYKQNRQGYLKDLIRNDIKKSEPVYC